MTPLEFNSNWSKYHGALSSPKHEENENCSPNPYEATWDWNVATNDKRMVDMLKATNDQWVMQGSSFYMCVVGLGFENLDPNLIGVLGLWLFWIWVRGISPCNVFIFPTNYWRYWLWNVLACANWSFCLRHFMTLQQVVSWRQRWYFDKRRRIHLLVVM
jgi:hypothetical protein